MAVQKVKVALTRTEVITLAGLLGGMYGETLADLYDTLSNHLQGDDVKIADDISRLLTELIELDEDSLLYKAQVNVKGVYKH